MLFDQGVLQVQQVVVGADLLPESPRFAGVAGSIPVGARGVAEAGHRLTDVVPGAQADGDAVASTLLAMLSSDQQVVLLAGHEAVTEGIANDAADLGDCVHSLLLGNGRLAG